MSTTSNHIHHRLQTELPYFARHALYIKDKSGRIIPFLFNTAQEYIHSKLEAQLKELGRVRAIILKGRQQGCSTYVSSRYYHKSTRYAGKSVFILSHEAETTKKLFAMVERFHDNCPDQLRPSTTIQNRRELKFDQLNGEYSVGTAGNEKVGRGGTLQYFHGSEVAFWEKTEGIQTGILQSVADIDDTEIILESTANGLGGMFHEKCMTALEGLGDYILIFVPWYWQLEYRRRLPPNFQLEGNEAALKEQFNLDNEQIHWRRKKIEDLKSLKKFYQEYPMTVKEAFVYSSNPLIDEDCLLAARKSKVTDSNKPLIVGVDPGRTGDRCIIARRRGREALLHTVFPYTPQMQMRLAGRLATIIDTENVAKMFIDVGHGYGTIDRLHELGYQEIVQGVHFSEGAIDDDRFLNKRAEMYIKVRDWIEGGGVSIPDDEDYFADLACVPDYEETSLQKIFIIAKKIIKKLFGKSPDIFDGLGLTFAYPVRSAIMGTRKRLKKDSATKGQSPLKTLNRQRQSQRQDTGLRYKMTVGR